MSFAIFLGALLAASAASATTYVRVEKDGSKTYSDRPIPGGQPVEIEPVQTYSAPPSTLSTETPSDSQLVRDMDNFQYQSCEITPKNDETFMNPESVSIAIVLRPLLRIGDVVNFTVDGAAVPNGALNFTLSPAHRGAHAVAVKVSDRYGRSLCAASSTFHVFQPGLNSPARRPVPPPPKK